MRVYASAEMTLTDTNDGVSVTGIDRYYMASSSSSGITVDSKGWEPDPQETNPISRYHWSYEVVKYSDGAAIPSKPAVIGVYGKDGKEGIDAVTVSLSSEAHTFAGTESQAIASSLSIDINAFKGTQRIPTSIGTVTGGIIGQLEHSELGRGTTSNKLVINVTNLLNKANGTLSIPIVADGRTFNKVFSWSVAFKGIPGKNGTDGTTTYTWIRYADTPTSGMENSPVGKKYIGLSFNQTTQTESNSYDDYQWSLMPQNIDIGGRNYLKSSDLSSATKILAEGGVYDFSINREGTTPLFANLKLEKGKYIFHIIMQKPAGDSVASIRFHKNNATFGYYGRYPEVDGEWNRLEIPFEVADESDVYGAQIYNHNFGDSFAATVKVMHLMIEKGNTATDWTPAPEDAQSEIDETKEQVKKTVKTITEEYYQSTSATSQTGGDWTTTAPTWKEGRFIFIRSKITYVDDTTDYTPIVNITGAKGDTGDTGRDGNPGKDGVGIQKTELHYASSTSGTTKPSTGWNLAVPSTSPGDYIWTRTTWTYTDGSTEEGYSVSRIGKDGNTGKDGNPGKDGVGIKGTVINYATSSSGTIKPTSGWTSTVPSVTPGNYLWTRTVWTYTDNDTEEGYSVSRIGEKGDKGDTGDKGATGTGIKSAEISYVIHTNGTTAPTLGWVSTVPTPVQGRYMWTRTITTYTDNTTSTTYSVAYQATNGQRGETGAAGTGISSTTVTYAQTTSGTTTPTSWNTTRPAPIKGQYLWSRTIITYTNGTSSTAYSTSYSATDGQKGDKGDTGPRGPDGPQGLPGKNGANGTTTYTWIRYADTPTSGMDQHPIDKKYIGLAFNQTTQTESDNYDDYQWSLMPQNIEIGGRNYFSLTHLNDISPSSWVVGAYVYNFTLEPNTKYILSSNVPTDGISSETVLYFNGSGTESSGVWLNNPKIMETDNEGKFYIAIPTGRTYTDKIRNGDYWVQLEKGNTATDWTPAPEDLYKYSDDVAQAKADAERIKAESYADGKVSAEEKERIAQAEQVLKDAKAHALQSIENIDIGGRNLILDSNNIIMNGSDRGTNAGLAVRKEDHISIIPKGDGNVYANGAVKTSLDRIQGETYTISLEVNTLESTGMYWYVSNNYIFNDIIPNTNGKWVRGSHTYTQSGETKDGDIGFLWGFNKLTAGKEIKYRNLKLEKGNKATDWTPAPEDTQSQIDNTKEQVKKTVKTITEEYYQSTSATSQTGGGWTETAPTWKEGRFIFIRSKITYVDGTTDYTPIVNITGAKGDTGKQGPDGPEGPRGIPGDKGDDGQSQWVHIRYSPNPTGSGMTSSPSSTTKYVGIAVTNSATAPAFPEFTWSKYVGEKGDVGERGVPGDKGDDGQTTYTWVRYADTPTSGMEDFPAGKKYIGLAFNQTTQTESNNYNDYQWSLMPQNINIGGRNYFSYAYHSNRDNYEFSSAYSHSKEPIQLEPNTEYILSYEDLVRFESGQYVLFMLDSSDRRVLSIFNVIGMDGGTPPIAGEKEYIFTTNDDGLYRFSYYAKGKSYANAPEGEWFTDIFSGFQIEKGNTATDWSPAPEDLYKYSDDVAQAKAEAERIKAEAYADGIVTTEERERIAQAEQVLKDAKAHALESIENIKVGGRNYFSRQAINNIADASNKLSTSSSWKGYYFSVNEGEQYTIHRTDTTNNRWRFYWVYTDEVVGSTTHTIVFSSDSQDSHVPNTVKAPTGAKWGYLYLSNSDSDGSTVPNIMIEKGNKATDWTPAPEDIQASIDDHQDQLDKTIDTEQLNTVVADINADKLSVESYEEFLSSYEGTLDEVNRSIGDVATDIGKALSRTNIIETTLGEGAQDWLFTNTKIRMSDEGITLGDASSGTYLQISSERISFFAGATDEVAYVSGGMLYINKAIFVQSIQVAEYLISKELDGHLTYRFVGMV